MTNISGQSSDLMYNITSSASKLCLVSMMRTGDERRMKVECAICRSHKGMQIAVTISGIQSVDTLVRYCS